MRHVMLMLVVLILSSIGAAQVSGAESVRVYNVASIKEVEVAIDFNRRDLVVPYCAIFESYERVLCHFGAKLQMRTSSGWIDVKRASGYGLVGGTFVWDAKSVNLNMEAHNRFIYSFIPDEYVVKKGDLLRVRIDVWATDDSMRKREPPMHLYSEEFSYK